MRAAAEARRVSRSLESLDEILRTLQEITAANPAWRKAESTTALNQEAAVDAVMDEGEAPRPSLRSFRSQLDSERLLFPRGPSSPSAHPDEAAPRPQAQDKYVDMHDQDWDVYESREHGRLLYYNPTSEESSWKPPRRRRSSSSSSAHSRHPSLPRTNNSIFTFGSEIAEDDDEQTLKRESVVRDSIRRSNESSVVPPPGYTELYDKETGLICYHDNVRDVRWFTALDTKGVLYFYTKDGRSEWELPSVPSALRGRDDGDGATQTDGEQRQHPLTHVVRKGHAERKFKSSASASSAASGKWGSSFVAVGHGYLLLFPDEAGFRRMGTDSAPAASVDLSQCHLRWRGLSSSEHCGLELKSKSGGVHLVLRWRHLDDALAWFDAVAPFVREVASDAPRDARSTPVSPAARTEFVSSHSAPGTPFLPAKSAARKVEISAPSNVVKASPQELRDKLFLAASNPDLREELSRSLQAPPPSPSRPKHSPSPKPGQPRAGKAAVGGRSLLSQSFRRMTEAVHLRPKSNSRLDRTPSRRSQLLSKFFDARADESDRRKSRDELIKRGIIQNEAVFGNTLENIKKDAATGLPEFLVRCIKRIEEFIDTVGVYRINGDAAVVQKLRLEVDRDSYKLVDGVNDVSLLASALKLFFRELPDPVIDRATRDRLYACISGQPKEAEAMRLVVLEHMQPLTRRVLREVMLHLARVVARASNNKMDARNLATVFSPNLVHDFCGGGGKPRRPESIMTEMEKSNAVVERMLVHAKEVFKE